MVSAFVSSSSVTPAMVITSSEPVNTFIKEYRSARIGLLSYLSPVIRIHYPFNLLNQEYK